MEYSTTFLRVVELLETLVGARATRALVFAIVLVVVLVAAPHCVGVSMCYLVGA